MNRSPSSYSSSSSHGSLFRNPTTREAAPTPQQPRSERRTQDRAIRLFADKTHPGGLGYDYLGAWHERPGNRPIETAHLRANLAKRGYSEAHRSDAIRQLENAADSTGVTLYQANLRTYQLLRYPVQVQVAQGRPHDDVYLIDWEHPANNDFALAEEVTLRGGYERRPDLVLYINGIAIAVIELKRASVEVGDGIRQLITNQEEIFNKGFFSTVQLLIAGNDTQGLRYGTTGTPEKFFVPWKGKGTGAAAAGAGTRAAIKKHSGEELDIKPYEADMRHLINTYIQADPAAPIGNVDHYSLVELIIDTGIHDAIARKLNEKGTLTKNAIAEGIINNVRKTIVREQLTDPRFYGQMSKLLDDLIRQRRDDTESYEEFLKKADALVQRLAKKQPVENVPAALHGKAEATVVFNHLSTLPATSFVYPTTEELRAGLAIEIDRVVRERAPAGWKGDEVREREVLNALYPIMGRDRDATKAIFDIIKRQPGYS